MVVVSDSSVITGLLAINKLFLLPQLFQKILITPCVFNELSSLEKYGYSLKSLDEDWISVRSITDVQRLASIEVELDQGEAESIVLAIEEKANYLLIDEKKGRKIDKREGLKIIGLLGVLIQAKKLGLIPSLKIELETLSNKVEFRLHENLIEAALAAVGEK